MVHFSSFKSKRVVRSCLGGETLALADAVDMAIAMRTDFELIVGKKFPISIYTDSRSLFDVITRNTTTTEKRLMVDIRAIREAYEHMEISDVAWIRSENNPADALTKVKENHILNGILDNGRIAHAVEQWVIRSAEIT